MGICPKHTMKRVALLFLIFPMAAKAVPITEPDQLVGPVTLIDFEGVSPSPNPVTISGVTFSAPLANFGVTDTNLSQASVDFPDYVSGLALGSADSNGAPPNFTITFSSGVAQVGFGLFDPNFPGSVISAFDSGGTLLESTAPDDLFPPGGSGADYLGFSRAAADIVRIEIVASNNPILDVLWVDKLAFSSTPASEVAEPGSLGLLGLGLSGIGALRSRRKEEKVPRSTGKSGTRVE